jgi:hypothetical protein
MRPGVNFYDLVFLISTHAAITCVSRMVSPFILGLRQTMRSHFKFLIAFTIAYFCGYAWAAPELQVKFHMGVGNGSTQAVGGTLINAGDAPIAQGYLVITPIATQCHPKASILHPIGLLAPGEEQQFNIPVAERFSSYRLQMGAFDEQGFAVTAKDANQAILDGRIDEERKACSAAR